MRRHTMMGTQALAGTWLFAVLTLGGAASAADAQTTIEYVAHACFIIESASGTRIAIDPYNGSRWLGYEFPEPQRADAVLVTHPHHDHDAGYYFGAAPTFRRAGRYQVGDITITGIEGRHADPYGAEFGQLNTLWLIEVDGLRVAHLGDNGLPRRAALTAMRRVDVLMVPADGSGHILQPNEIASIRDVLRPAVTIPMHYRLGGLTERPASLGPVDPWLDGQSGVVRLDTHRLSIAPDALPDDPEIWVPRPSPAVRPWRASLARAWEEHERAVQARDGESWPSGRVEALEHLQAAVELAPDVSVFAFDLAEVLRDAGRPAEAIDVLERSLAAAARHDRAYTMRSHALLARLYAQDRHPAAAAEQYRLVMGGSVETGLLDEARTFLDGYRDGEQPPTPTAHAPNGLEERGRIALDVDDAPVEKRYVLRYPSNLDDWNGTLLIGVHGGTGGELADADGTIIGTSEVALDDVIGDHALADGYAYASVDRDGIGASPAGVATVTQFTERMRARLRTVAQRAPERTYLVGLSMGGGITRMAVEDPASDYDGVVIIAGAGGDLPTRLERTAQAAGLWSEVDPRIPVPLPDSDPRVQAYARIAGTPVEGRVFWPFTGASASYEGLRRTLASYGLEHLSDEELHLFSFDRHRSTEPFGSRVRAADTTGRVLLPTLEVVGTFDDLVAREVRVYRQTVERATAGDGRPAPAELHRLYQVYGAWHISPEDDATGGFQYRASRMNLGPAIQDAMAHGGSYVPAVRDALTLLDRWVREGVEPPPSTTVPASGRLID